MGEMRTPDQIVLDAFRAEVKTLLSQCPEDQQARFARLTKCEVDDLSEEQLRVAIELLQRSIVHNVKKLANQDSGQ